MPLKKPDYPSDITEEQKARIERDFHNDIAYKRGKQTEIKKPNLSNA